MDDQTFLNQLAEKLSKLGTVRPLGFHYLHPYGTVPADSIICNGATYSRALYKDFFDYITTQGWVKTEAEWQEIATRDNGFCPFYSSGDGSTNFRTPKFAPYQQVAMGVAQTTTYHQAGLPNITGYWNTRGPEMLTNATGGAFSIEATSDLFGYGHSSGGASPKLKFDASSSSSVFGLSSTVQPESHEWVMCVVAYGVATNVGSVDMADVLTTVAQVQADVSVIPKPKAYVTETWRSGAQWYRRWSDGWLEQGGRLKLQVWTGGSNPTRTFSLPTAFSNDTYTTVVTGEGGYGWATLKGVSQTTSSVTVTGTGASTDDRVSYVHFYCSGY